MGVESPRSKISMRVAPTSRQFKGTANQYHARPGFLSQPRTSQTKIRPTMADPIPISRREKSGVSSYSGHRPFGRLRERRENQALNDKNQSERGQEVRHTGRARSLAGRRLGGRRRRRILARLAGRVREIAKEIRVRLEQQASVTRFQAVLVSLHRAIECEEVRILIKGVGKDLIAGCVALASNLLRLRGRLGDQTQ